jgi:enoyl-[acyl-carrier protein] reductase II
LKTRITELLGIEHPIIQAAMSWASSNSALVIAVSNAGGMGVLAAGPMRGHLQRFRGIGTKWLHVVASVEHAHKAEGAGVDALVVDGAEAGGHPPPAEVSTLVLVRRVVKAVKLPVVASGGIADGYGIAAMLALGAEGVQLGTRFIATPEASVHPAYKEAVLKADVGDTAFVGRGGHPIRQLRNAFSEKYAAAERAGATSEELEKLFAGATLKQAALEGDVHWGKVEAGQSAGLVDEILPAAEVMRMLVAEMNLALKNLNQGQTTISEAH